LGGELGTAGTGDLQLRHSGCSGQHRRDTRDGHHRDCLAYLFIGVIFGLVNALVRPLVSLLALPLTILTLGLFTIVINAAMLYLTSWISNYTPVHFTIDSFFWTAVFAAIIITLVSLVAGRITGTRR
jgi:putative membrane protein